MSFLFVGVGGFFGGLCRFQIGKVLSKKCASSFPFSTFMINITGAFLLGALTGSGVTGNTYLLLGEGFLGAYTTFSTLMFEHHHLATGDRKRMALLYLSGTVVIGVIGYALGYML